MPLVSTSETTKNTKVKILQSVTRCRQLILMPSGMWVFLRFWWDVAPSLAKNNSRVFPRGRPPTVDEDAVLKAFPVRGQRCLQGHSNVEL